MLNIVPSEITLPRTENRFITSKENNVRYTLFVSLLEGEARMSDDALTLKCRVVLLLGREI